MSEAIILLDIPSADYKSWSPNTWRTRLTLQYKGLPYKTQWVDYPDIQPVSIQYGAAPTDKRADGSPRYTVPMIYDPNTKTAIADSVKIAMYLDKTYPSTPTVFPPGSAALQMAFADRLWDSIGSDLFRNLAPDHFANLSPASLKVITPIIETIYGKATELGGEEYWVSAEKALGKVLSYVEANGGGEDGLMMGDDACFADFALVSIFVWARIVLGENSAGWKRIAGWHGGKWARFYARFEKYLVYEGLLLRGNQDLLYSRCGTILYQGGKTVQDRLEPPWQICETRAERQDVRTVDNTRLAGYSNPRPAAQCKPVDRATRSNMDCLCGCPGYPAVCGSG